MTLRRICATIGARHFLLLIVYFTYLSAFAFLLQIIERPRHLLMHRRQRLVALQKRHQFVSSDILPAIINTTELMLFVHGERTRRMGFILLKALDKYEQVLNAHRVPEFEDPFQSFDQTLLFVSFKMLISNLSNTLGVFLDNYTRLFIQLSSFDKVIQTWQMHTCCIWLDWNSINRACCCRFGFIVE